MQIYAIDGNGSPPSFSQLALPPAALPSTGFLWIALERSEFEAQLPSIQSHLRHWCHAELIDLHISDLLNQQLPSHFDDTSAYDLMVFRRLAPSTSTQEGHSSSLQPLALIDTNPIGFAVFERVLLTIHPAECQVRDYFMNRLEKMASSMGDLRLGTRLPTSPDDLMLRIVNHLVDSYLDLRRRLTRHLGDLQRELLRANNRPVNWETLLDARNALHLLEDICEDQQSAIQEWIDTLAEWPTPETPQVQKERELLRVRSRDVAEHITRVLSHVQRLGQSVENAMQMHFSAVSQRTNNIVRALTVITAIFLPLNLITGFFGMNFDNLPLIHSSRGFWQALGLMLLLGLGLGGYFWRKRYLSTH